MINTLQLFELIGELEVEVEDILSLLYRIFHTF